MLPRAHRLHEGDDIRRVRSRVRARAHPMMLLYALERRDSRESADHPTRVAVIAGRKVGGAVIRNRTKRRLREAVRALLSEIGPGWDIVIVARKAGAEASYGRLSAVLRELLARAGVVDYREEGAPCARSSSV